MPVGVTVTLGVGGAPLVSRDGVLGNGVDRAPGLPGGRGGAVALGGGPELGELDGLHVAVAEDEAAGGERGEVEGRVEAHGLGGETRARHQGSVGGEAVGEGRGVLGPGGEDAAHLGVERDDGEGAVLGVEFAESLAERVHPGAGVVGVAGLGSLVVGREDVVDGDGGGGEREDQTVGRAPGLEAVVGDDVKGTAVDGEHALGGGTGGAEERVAGPSERSEGETWGEYGQRRLVVTISGLSLRDRGGNTCRRSARRGARDAGSCPFSGSVAGTGIDDAKRARSSEVSATCGVGCAGFRRSSHLASEAVASKRLGGATTAKVGVGGCTNAVAVRAPGALYALVAGAMHMLSFLCFLGAWSSGRVVSGCCEGTEWHTRGSFAWPNANKRTDFASWRSFTGSQTRRPITNRQGTFRAESSDVADQ